MKRITAIIMLVALAGLLAWDVVVVVNDVQGDTISEIISELSARVWAIPFAFGVLMGHWFLPKRGERKLNWFQSIGVVALCGAPIIVTDIIGVFDNLELAILPLIYGAAVGHMFWPPHLPKKED